MTGPTPEQRAATMRPIRDAPRDGAIIRARINGHGDNHRIAWTAGISVDGDGSPCGAWVHHGPDDPPPCWTDGACWDSNADDVMSAPPVGWWPIDGAQP